MSSPRINAGLPRLDSLASRTLSDGGDLRPALLVALTELFVSRETPGAEAICRYEDMAFKLLENAGPGALAHVAARLSRHPFAPVSIIDRLLKSDRVCAAILLEHCSRLSTELQHEIAVHGTPDEAVALARRKALEPALANVLSVRKEVNVHTALVENNDVTLTPSIVTRLIASARCSNALAALLCSRILDTRSLTPLFLHAAPAQRIAIMRTAEFNALTSPGPKRIASANPVLIDWIVARARKGLWGLVAHEIERLTGFKRSTIDQMLAFKQGDGLAVLLAAIGFPAAKAIRIFLTCDPIVSHSYDRVKALAQIVEHMSANAACCLVHAIAGTAMDEPRIAHVPVRDPKASATPSRPLSRFSIARPPESTYHPVTLPMSR